MLDFIESRHTTTTGSQSKKVDLSGKDITYASPAPFIKYLLHRKKFTELDLSDSNVTTDMIKELVKECISSSIKF